MACEIFKIIDQKAPSTKILPKIVHRTDASCILRANVLFFCFLLLLSPVSCAFEDSVFSETISEIVGFKEIKENIHKALWDTDEGKLVALRMFDASTKIPNGLLAGNLFDLGNFDECYNLKYEDIYGKYCLGAFELSPLTKPYFDAMRLNTSLMLPRMVVHPEPRLAALGHGEYVGFHFAVCIPSNWSVADIPGLLTYSEEFCYSKATEPELSSGAIVTIVILSIFLVIVIISTVVDLVLYYNETEPPHELSMAFSAWSNGRKIFQSGSNPDQLLCLNGIRAISTMWVIIGHEYAHVMNAPLSNILDVADFLKNPINMFAMGATVSVDTFFVVSGLVTVYTFLKSVDKGVKFNLILFYVHRYLRLTPPFAVMSLIYLYLINYFGNGPLWRVVDLTLVKPCEEGWWISFLYITNYVQRGVCLPQTWYLSVDMQLFVLSPIILIPLARWPKVGLGLLGFLTILGCAVPFSVGYAENLGNAINFNPHNDLLKYANDYYLQTHTRFGPYVIGLLLGYFIYKIKKSEFKIRLAKPMIYTLWVVCLTCLTACLYAGHSLIMETEDDRWGNSLYLAFNRQAWSVSVSGIIFLCVAGYGGPIDKFLSLTIFQILTKVSYSMYLVHYVVMVLRYSAMKNIMQFSNFTIMHSFWGDFMFTFALSLILCLSFESPIVILEKYLFGTKLRSSQKKSEV